MIYQGGCHCGKISFEVEGQIDGIMECNCSICSQRGYLLWFIDRQKLKLLTPESNLSTYTFNKHQIKHRFCSTCGCGPFGEGTDPTGKSMAAVNVRSLRDFDWTTVKRTAFDGKSI
jgi:hypothetical protein